MEIDKKTIHNLREAKRLEKIYREFTTVEIEKYYKNDLDVEEIAPEITGFGSTTTCSLCTALDTMNTYTPSKDTCKGCFYLVATGSFCSEGPNKETYDAIERADEILNLYFAFRERANHIMGLLHDIGETPLK